MENYEIFCICKYIAYKNIAVGIIFDFAQWRYFYFWLRAKNLVLDCAHRWFVSDKSPLWDSLDFLMLVILVMLQFVRDTQSSAADDTWLY